MTRMGFSPPRRIRLGVAAAVGLLHVGLGLALIRAFAPAFSAQVAGGVLSAVTVTVPISPPESTPPPVPQPDPESAEISGGAGDAGRRAESRPIAAPSPRIVLPTQAAALVVGTGTDLRAGASDAGEGTGAGGEGSGVGSGASGSGRGGGGPAKAVKVAGDINSARDYPAVTREQRLGDHVIVALTVGTDGRVRNCRVHRASRDAQADAITCRLAIERFRFRPATDGNGNAVESVYGWQQRWFAPREK